MVKISWTNCMKNVEGITESRRKGMTYTQIKRRKVNWIGHILHRICCLNTLLKER